jgi:hypothetical protein
MKQLIKNTAIIITSSLIYLSSSAIAAEIEGVISSVDNQQQTIEIHNTKLLVDNRTRIENSRMGFADLRPGMYVEVDYIYLNNKLVATEIDLDD